MGPKVGAGNESDDFSIHSSNDTEKMSDGNMTNPSKATARDN